MAAGMLANKGSILTMLAIHYGFVLSCDRAELSTPHLRDLVIGRCTEFQINVLPHAFCDDYGNYKLKNCTELWEKFSAGFANKPLCNVSQEGFKDFIQTANHEVPENKSIFWEGVYGLVHRYSNRGMHLKALEDTLIGYIGDNLHFCGDPQEDDGIARNQSCPSYDLDPDCPSSAERVFWTQASTNYASLAKGEVFIMLNAAHKPVYSNRSYFSNYELPHLQPGRVTKATIYLIDANLKYGNSCNRNTIRILKSQLAAKNITSECVDNPRDVMLLHCSDHPASKACSVFANATCPKCLPCPSSGSGSQTKWIDILMFYVMIVLLALH